MQGYEVPVNHTMALSSPRYSTARLAVAAIREKHPQVPIIGFPKGAGAKLPAYARETGVDAVGVDETQEPEWVHAQLPPNAVVISWWSYSTPLWYHRWVLGERPDVARQLGQQEGGCGDDEPQHPGEREQEHDAGDGGEPVLHRRAARVVEG